MTKLKEKILVSGKIKLLTGLHIGGTNASVQIGGIDSSIIRDPVTQQPYIPGSSLKGKMRCLLEQHYGLLGESVGSAVSYGPSSDIGSPVVRLFGSSKSSSPHPSLVIFRDSFMHEPEVLFNNKNTDLPYSEIKTEVVIDRIYGTATPRQIERVPAGTIFNFEIILNVWDMDKMDGKNMFLKEEESFEILAKGMNLLENDYLGGKGTRGSGQIKFLVEKINKVVPEYSDIKQNLKAIFNKYKIEVI